MQKLSISTPHTKDSNLRLPQVKKATGLSTSTIWRLEKEGLFPKRRKISKRAVAWLSSEIDSYINNIVFKKSKKEPP